MGQGGYITLVNGTDCNWQLSYQHSYQMDCWNFPESIAAKSCVRIYVEWQERLLHVTADDGAEATYTLENNSKASFQLQARAKEGFQLQVFFSTLQSRSHPAGSVLPLGWKHNGNLSFVLTGQEGHYIATGLDASSWLSDNLALLADKPLRQICLVGSHDSGMSLRYSGTAFGTENNTLTQRLGIGGQLNYGARYFDIRPVISAGCFYTGHYSQIANISWQGANGQSIQAIVDEINAFTASHNELVILNLSHSLNTDIGNFSYRSFNQQEWDKLFMLLDKINYLYSADSGQDLTALTLNDFIADGPAVLIICEESDIELAERNGKGYYPYRSFNVYNSYANSNQIDTMAEDQLAKMRDFTPGSYFLLSWTLTQNALQAVLGTPSIISLADEAKQNLAWRLYPEVTAEHYPNIIYLDDIVDSGGAAMALAVNYKLHG